MEPFQTFEMWRDYLGLAALLARLRQAPTATAATAAATETAAATAAATAASSGTASPCGPRLCAFCRRNGESRHVYTGHNLHGAGGRVECPVLRRYVCPQCGATRDAAHTRRFCPLTRRGYVSVYRAARRRRPR